jgi:hypothetical protein
MADSSDAVTFEHGEWTVRVAVNECAPRTIWEEVFRTTIRDDRECELFTLLFTDSDDALVQLTLFRNGDLISETWEPAIVMLRGRKKQVYIEFLQPVVHPDEKD